MTQLSKGGKIHISYNAITTGNDTRRNAMLCMVQDIPIYYEEYGSGKSILCIHGYSAGHQAMIN